MNQWESINLRDYETHMRSKKVFQLQTLNMIMADQMKYKPDSVAVLGAAGGNGFEHLHSAHTIYAIDINEDYLRHCGKKYTYLGDKLKLIQCDLHQAVLPSCDLLICNLIIEYLGIESFAKLLERSQFKLASCVIQKNCGNSFVSASKTATKLEPLNSLHHDIEAEELIKRLGRPVVLQKNYALPNNKEFVRIDFND